MGFEIRYKRLFSVEILHGFHLDQSGGKSFEALSSQNQAQVLRDYDIGEDLIISPTAATARLLRSRKWIFRATPTGFFVGTEVDFAAAQTGIFKPALPIRDEVVLRFSIRLANPYFFNYTNLRLSGNLHKPYYFSNLAGNIQGGKAYLSLPIQGFNNSATYEAGDLHVDNEAAPTQLFEALRAKGPGPFDPADWREVLPVSGPAPVAPFNTGDALLSGNSLYVASEPTPNPPPGPEWEETVLGLQYTGFQDRIPIYPPLFGIDIAAASASKATLKLTRPGEASPRFTQTAEASPSLRTFFADLRTAEPGRYEFRLENQAGVTITTPFDGLFYHDPTLYGQQVLGIVEISFQPGMAAGPYDWLSAPGGELLSPVYTLRFKNRATFWRFIFNRDQIVADADLGELERDGPASEKRTFRTREPRPLTRTFEPVKKFDTNQLLPNPQIQLVKPDPGDHRIYSEVFINY